MAASQDNPLKPLSKPQEEAALLLAIGELTDEEIGAKVGRTRESIRNWKRDARFLAVVDEHRQQIRHRIRNHGIAVIENRVQAKQRRWDKLNQIIDARAADAEMQDVPGGKTGLLVHNKKSIGFGAAAEIVDVYELDTGLLSEMRALEKEVSQELGQWEEKHDHRHSGSIDLDVTLSTAKKLDAALDDADLMQLREIARRASQKQPGNPDAN